MITDNDFLARAIELAEESVNQGGFPAGALIVKGGEVISEGISIGNVLHDPTAHAESVAVRKAAEKLGSTNLNGAILYSSLEPCLMCFSASAWAGISKNIHATKKTNEMVKKSYYEGTIDIQEVNRSNNVKVEIIHNSELENKSLELIKKWENLNLVSK